MTMTWAKKAFSCFRDGGVCVWRVFLGDGLRERCGCLEGVWGWAEGATCVCLEGVFGGWAEGAVRVFGDCFLGVG